ncbi:Uncharacterised protein [Cedecea neteri]|uniref:Uncharacterized protein n=1 Tax=Cedecea neteri TaxID=158822 RepID=A0A2X3IGE1_9ENTR|nr:Uncharacterised protein [Cedecea neteri]
MSASPAYVDALNKFIEKLPGATEKMGSFIESMGTFFDGLTKDLRIDSISAKLDGVDLKDYRAEGYATRQAAATPELVPFYAEEYHQIAGNLNFDADTAAKQSERYQVSLYRLETVFDILREKAGSGLAQNLVQPFETLTNTILVSFPKIEPTVNNVLSVLGDIANVVGSAINGTIGWVYPID